MYYYMKGVGMLAACVVAALSVGVSNALRKAADDAVGLAGMDDVGGGGVWYVNNGSGSGMGVKGAQRGWIEMIMAMMPPVVGVNVNSSVVRSGDAKR